MNKIIKQLPMLTTYALGAIFLIFGLNGFLGFLPTPPMEGSAAAFMGGLGASGYFFPLLKLTEISIGLALLTRRFVPLALVVLAPISLQILAFHLFLAPQGIALPLFIVVAHVALAYHHRSAYQPLFVSKASTEGVRRAALSV